MHIFWTGLAASVLLLPLGAAWAQGDMLLETIDVVGTTPFAGSDVDADRYPANVQSADAEAIQESQTLTISEFLVQELGSVYINDAVNNAFQPDLKYRGYVASPLLGLPQGISVYVDGVRVNEPFGATVNWDMIPQAAIASIDLLPGSNPLFGLNTLGGALNIKTKTGFSHPGLVVEAFGGDFGRYGGHVAYGVNDGDVGLFLLAQGMAEDGWRDFSESEVQQLFGQLSTLTDRGEIHFSITAADNTLRGNGAVPEALAEAEGRDSIFTYPDETSPELVMFNLRGVRDFTDTVSVAWGGYYRHSEISTFNGDGTEFEQCEPPQNPAFLCEENEATGTQEVVQATTGNPVPFSSAVAGGTENTSSTDQDGYGLHFQLRTPGLIAGELISGVSLDYASTDFQSRQEIARLTDERGTVGSGFFTGDAVTRLTARNSNVGIFLLQRTPLTDTVEWSLGGRYNITNIMLSDRTPAFAQESGQSLDGDHTFKRLNLTTGLTWQLNPGLSLFASVGQSSRAPSPVELTCANPDDPCRLPNGFVDDPPLSAVVATTFEVGARGGNEQLGWSAAVFHATNQNDIIFIAAPGNRFRGFFDNVGETVRQGVELALNWVVTTDLRLSANYTYLNAEFRDDFMINSPNHPNRIPDPADPGGETIAAPSAQQVKSGDRIPLIPEHLFGVGLDWAATEKLGIGFDVIGNSDQIFRGDASNTADEQVDGYAIVNAHAEYAFSDALSVFVRVDNVFDQDYETFGVYGEAAEVLEGERYEDAYQFIGPGAPRGIWGGFRLTL